MNNLTGKTRYRVQAIGWLGPKKHLLVLQVEYSGLVLSREEYEHTLLWRDATTEDLASLDIKSTIS